MSFKGVQGNTTFNAANLGLNSTDGYSVAIYLSAIDEPANELKYGSLGIYFAEGAAKFGVYLTMLVGLVSLSIF